MVRNRRNKRHDVKAGVPGAERRTSVIAALPQIQTDCQNRYFEILVISMLFVFGIYLSVLYFGHQVVPNSDFPGFVRAGQSILSFEIPSSFKRAPVLGILQIGLSKFLGEHGSILTAGWLLNAIVYPFSIVLFYLIGKEFLGKSAALFAVVAAVNPWAISMFGQPIVETTLVFFTLLTFYFILRRSSWCYVFASIATMVRYEGAGLIVAAFVLDMLESETNRQRLRAFLYSVLASVPLALWLFGTFAGAEKIEGGIAGAAYIRNYGGSTVFVRYLNQLWQIALKPLFMVTSQESVGGVYAAGKIIAVILFPAAAFCALYKRKWKQVSLLLFFVLFVLVHALRSVTRTRYGMPVGWLTLLLCWYGLQSIWLFINQLAKPPKWVKGMLQIFAMAGAVIWLSQLVPFLTRLAPYSQRSVSLPYVAIGIVVVLFLVRLFFCRPRFLLANITACVLICLMLVSNQFELVKLVGNGKGDAEFKKLADWYVANALPGEKMVTTLPGTVKLFVPQYGANFVHTGRIRAEGPEGFVTECYKREIAYVAWDSRIGFATRNKYYSTWGISRIAMLGAPRDVGPYKFITQVKQSDSRFINIFRLVNLTPPAAKNKAKPPPGAH